MPESASPSQPTRTLILIGASNLTFNLPDIWRGLSAEKPTRLIVAAGHGRSFGLPSTVLGRTLPGLIECGLWSALSELPDDGPRTALVTDIGNDLLYGADPETIAGWVQQCVDRLLDLNFQPAVTALPLDSIRSLSRFRFHIFRRFLFAASRLTFEDALSQSTELAGRIEEIALSRDIPVLRPQAEWYGLDPIHFRRRIRAAAWTTYLSALDESARAEKCWCLSGIGIWRCRPAERIRRGQRLETPQPVLDHAGSQLWLF